jgi:hypothetical protein
MRLNEGEYLRLYKEFRELSKQDLAFKLHHLNPTDRKMAQTAFGHLATKCTAHKELSPAFIDWVLKCLKTEKGTSLWQLAARVLAPILGMKPVGEVKVGDRMSQEYKSQRLEKLRKEEVLLLDLIHFKSHRAYPEFVSLIQFYKVLPHSTAEAVAIIQERIYTLDVLAHAARSRGDSAEFVHLLEVDIKGALFELRDHREDFAAQLEISLRQAQARAVEYKDHSQEERELKVLQEEIALLKEELASKQD